MGEGHSTDVVALLVNVINCHTPRTIVATQPWNTPALSISGDKLPVSAMLPKKHWSIEYKVEASEGGFILDLLEIHSYFVIKFDHAKCPNL
jgi:hypothetical protein